MRITARLQHTLNTIGNVGFEGQDGRGKNLARFTPLQLALTDRPPSVIAVSVGNSQTVQVGVQLVVKRAKIFDLEVRLANRIVTPKPYQSGFFCMLVKHGGNDRQRLPFPGKTDQFVAVVYADAK